jgi:hypothetical protein
MVPSQHGTDEQGAVLYKATPAGPLGTPARRVEERGFTPHHNLCRYGLQGSLRSRSGRGRRWSRTATVTTKQAWAETLGGGRAYVRVNCAGRPGSCQPVPAPSPKNQITRLCRMSTIVAQVIAALSAFTALASVLLYLYFGRRSEFAAAREEALALAETRRQVIADLQSRLDSLEQRCKRTKADCERRVNELQTALDETQRQASDEAYRTQHFFLAALADLLNELRNDLEPMPPDVEAALARIRKLLTDERPAA